MGEKLEEVPAVQTGGHRLYPVLNVPLVYCLNTAVQTTIQQRRSISRLAQTTKTPTEDLMLSLPVLHSCFLPPAKHCGSKFTTDKINYTVTVIVLKLEDKYLKARLIIASVKPLKICPHLSLCDCVCVLTSAGEDSV